MKGLRIYIFSTIDVHTRIAFAYAHTRLSYANAPDFLEKLLKVAPLKIERIQRDNGSEFEGEFDKLFQEKGIAHFYTYSQDPQSLGNIKTLNITVSRRVSGIKPA